jgi:pimeloyl-ACP methyl ester carboxylesterase
MRAASVEASGLELAFEEEGSGTSLVLVHGTATDRTLWRETVLALGGDLRSISYDRRDYGRSGAPDAYAGTTVAEQADDASALIASLDAAPALLAGHGLGAVVCLDILVRRPELASGALLIEPMLLSLSPRGPDLVSALRQAIEQGARAGGPAGAVDAYLALLGGGPAILARLGAERLAAARAVPRAFAADVGAIASWEFARRDLRGIAAPVLVLAGESDPAVIAEAAGALVRLVPRAELRRVPGGHFLPLEAPGAVATAIRELTAR